MRVLIDADGCPVVDLAIRLANQRNLEVWLFCDTAHVMDREGATTFTLPTGADSVDFALVNRIQPLDIVITQDYGLAAMALAKRALPINQDGMRYTDDNLLALLGARHMAQRVRRGGGRLKGPSPRKPNQNEAFAAAFEALLDETMG